MTISADKASIAGWYKKHPAVFFVLSFALLMLVFYIIYFSPFIQTKFLPKLISLYAHLSNMLLHVLGYQTIVSGDVISSAQFSVGIKQGCDAVEPMAIFIAGVLAFPVKLKKKFSGIVAGISILFVINLFRIISLYMAGVHNKALFEALHEVVWQIVFILIAIGLLFIWLQWATKKK